MLIEKDLFYFILAGVALLIALIIFGWIFFTRSKSKHVSFSEFSTDYTKTLRHTVTQQSTHLENEITEEVQGEETEVDGDITELMDGTVPIRKQGMIGKVINDTYRIERLLGKGGMSAVYLCENTRVGNKWAMKHIFHQANAVLAEENILKQLNHINLPKIVDVFKDVTGTYIIESYIEGIGLNKIIENNAILDEEVVIDYALQLSDVLNYLHTIKPVPIIHRDLKPSNIIVTNDNKLVLIDFGISKQATDIKDTVVAVSKNYAAPEQFKGRSDARTDIFSFGVILYQLATRHLPNMPGFDSLLKDSVSVEIADIILKCLKINPEERYQSVEELRHDLSKLNYSKIQNIKKAFSRKVMTGVASCFVVASCVLGYCSYWQYTNLNKIELEVEPEVLFLTEQERSDLFINQLLADGNNAAFDSRFVTWEYSDINVARIEANEIIAMNIGTTQAVGTYRNKLLKLNVNVVKPDGMTDIRLKYNTNFNVTDYAGNGTRDLADGTMDECSMISPQSIDVAPDGSIYFTDSGYLRQLINGEVATFEIDPPYIKPKLVKAISSSEMWFVTEEWQDEDGYFRGIIRVSDEYGFEGIYIVAASEHDILDITTNSKGEIFFLEQNMIEEKTYIKHFTDIYQEPEIYAQVPYTTVSMTMDENDHIYLADMEKAVLYRYNEETRVCDYLAGVKDDKNFIDGVNARFYMPYKVKIYGDYLYVFDYNVLRRISIAEDSTFDVETVAGKAGFASPEDLREGKGYEIFFEKNRMRDMTISLTGEILVTDPELSVIRKIEYIPEKSKEESVTV